MDGRQIAQARTAIGLTQRDLARRSGVAVRHIARIESGWVGATPETYARLLRAARPDARDVLARHHDDIVAAAIAARGTGYVRVFGSVARGDDRPDSDIDLLVEFTSEADLFDVVDLERRLAQLLRRRVDVVSTRSAGRAARHALRDAVRLP